MSTQVGQAHFTIDADINPALRQIKALQQQIQQQFGKQLQQSGLMSGQEEALKQIRAEVERLTQSTRDELNQQLKAARVLKAEYDARVAATRAASLAQSNAAKEAAAATRQAILDERLKAAAARAAGIEQSNAAKEGAAATRRQKQAIQDIITSIQNQQKASVAAYQMGQISAQQLIAEQKSLQKQALRAASAFEQQSTAYRQLTQSAAAAARVQEQARSRMANDNLANTRRQKQAIQDIITSIQNQQKASVAAYQMGQISARQLIAEQKSLQTQALRAASAFGQQSAAYRQLTQSAAAAARAQEQARSRMANDNLAKVRSELASLRAEYERAMGAAGRFDFARQRQASNNYSAALRGLQAQLHTLGQQSNLTAQQMGAINRTQQQIASQQNALNGIFTRVGLAGNVTNALRSLPQLAAQAGGSLGVAAAQASSFGTGLSEIAAAAGPTGVAIAAVTAAIVAFAAAAIPAVRAAIDFEAGIAKISTLTDQAPQQLGAVADGIREISVATGATALDLQNGLYDILGASVEGTEDMAAALEYLNVAARLAAAAQTDTATATNVLTSVMNAYKMSASEAGDVSDMLFKAVDIGKMSFEQLARSLGMVTAVSAQAGVSLDEVLAAMATMTANGIHASSAVDYLRSMISSIIKPSGQAVKLAAELGLGFNAQALEAKGLTGVLKDVITTTGGSSEKMAVLFGGVEALTAATSIASGEFDRMEASLEGIANAAGATDAAYDKVASTTQSAIASLKASFEALKGEVGESLLAVTGSGIDALMRFVNWLRELNVSFQEAAAAYQQYLQPFLDDLAPHVQSVIDEVGPYFESFAEFAKGVFHVIASVIQNIFIPAFEMLWPFIQPILAVMAEGVAGVLRGLGATFMTVGRGLQGDWRGAMQAVADATKDNLGVAKDLVDQYAPKLQNAFGNMAQLIVGSFAEKLGGLAGALSGALANLLEWVQGAAPAWAQGIVGALANALRRAATGMGALSEAGGKAATTGETNLRYGQLRGDIVSAAMRRRGDHAADELVDYCARWVRMTLGDISPQIQRYVNNLMKFDRNKNGPPDANDAAQGFREVGIFRSYKGTQELKPGDVVFYEDDGYGHMGIYMGKNIVRGNNRVTYQANGGTYDARGRARNDASPVGDVDIHKLGKVTGYVAAEELAKRAGVTIEQAQQEVLDAAKAGAAAFRAAGEGAAKAVASATGTSATAATSKAKDFDAYIAEAQRINNAIQAAQESGDPEAWRKATAELEKFKAYGPMAAEALTWVGTQAKSSSDNVSQFGEAFDDLKRRLGVVESLSRLGESTESVKAKLVKLREQAQNMAALELKDNGQSARYAALLDLAADASQKLTALDEKTAKETEERAKKTSELRLSIARALTDGELDLAEQAARGTLAQYENAVQAAGDSAQARAEIEQEWSERVYEANAALAEAESRRRVLNLERERNRLINAEGTTLEERQKLWAQFNQKIAGEEAALQTTLQGLRQKSADTLDDALEAASGKAKDAVEAYRRFAESVTQQVQAGEFSAEAQGKAVKALGELQEAANKAGVAGRAVVQTAEAQAKAAINAGEAIRGWIADLEVLGGTEGDFAAGLAGGAAAQEDIYDARQMLSRLENNDAGTGISLEAALPQLQLLQNELADLAATSPEVAEALRGLIGDVDAAVISVVDRLQASEFSRAVAVLEEQQRQLERDISRNLISPEEALRQQRGLNRQRAELEWDNLQQSEKWLEMSYEERENARTEHARRMLQIDETYQGDAAALARKRLRDAEDDVGRDVLADLEWQYQRRLITQEEYIERREALEIAAANRAYDRAIEDGADQADAERDRQAELTRIHRQGISDREALNQALVGYQQQEASVRDLMDRWRDGAVSAGEFGESARATASNLLVLAEAAQRAGNVEVANRYRELRGVLLDTLPTVQEMVAVMRTLNREQVLNTADQNKAAFAAGLLTTSDYVRQTAEQLRDLQWQWRTLQEQGDFEGAESVKALAEALTAGLPPLIATRVQTELLKAPTEALESAQQALAQVLGQTPPLYQSEIQGLEALKLEYPELAAQLDEIIGKYKELRAAREGVATAESFKLDFKSGQQQGQERASSAISSFAAGLGALTDPMTYLAAILEQINPVTETISAMLAILAPVLEAFKEPFIALGQMLASSVIPGLTLLANIITPIVQVLTKFYDAVANLLYKISFHVIDIRRREIPDKKEGKENNDKAKNSPKDDRKLAELLNQNQLDELDLQYKQGYISFSEYEAKKLARVMERLERERQEEIEAAKGDAELIAAINEKYRIKRATEEAELREKLQEYQAELAKQASESALKELELELRQGLITKKEYEQRKYNLTIQRLERERQEEIEAAKGDAELIYEINRKYDALELEAKLDMLDVLSERYREIGNTLRNSVMSSISEGLMGALRAGNFGKFRSEFRRKFREAMFEAVLNAAIETAAFDGILRPAIDALTAALQTTDGADDQAAIRGLLRAGAEAESKAKDIYTMLKPLRDRWGITSGEQQQEQRIEIVGTVDTPEMKISLDMLGYLADTVQNVLPPARSALEMHTPALAEHSAAIPQFVTAVEAFNLQQQAYSVNTAAFGEYVKGFGGHVSQFGQHIAVLARAIESGGSGGFTSKR